MPVAGARNLTHQTLSRLYYATNEGAIVGPFDLDALRQMVQAGVISETTLVAADGDTEWTSWHQKSQSLMAPAMGCSDDKDELSQPPQARIEDGTDTDPASRATAVPSERLDSPGSGVTSTTRASAEVEAQLSAQDAALKAQPSAPSGSAPRWSNPWVLGTAACVVLGFLALANRFVGTSLALELPNSLSCNADSFPAVRGDGSLIFDAKEFFDPSQGVIVTDKFSVFGPAARRLGGGWVFAGEGVLESPSGRIRPVDPGSTFTIEPTELRGRGRFKVKVTADGRVKHMYCIEAAQSELKKED